MMTLREKISAVAKERGRDVKAIATEAGISYNTLRSYMRPQSNKIPSAPKGIAIARALNVDVHWLFDNERGMPPPPFVPPLPADIGQLFAHIGVSWYEIGLAVTLKKHVEQCKELACMVAQFAKQGRDSEAKTIKNYLQIKKRLWKAADSGNYERTQKLLEKMSQMESDPFIGGLIFMETERRQARQRLQNHLHR